jgi:hypothetical protein
MEKCAGRALQYAAIQHLDRWAVIEPAYTSNTFKLDGLMRPFQGTSMSNSFLSCLRIPIEVYALCRSTPSSQLVRQAKLHNLKFSRPSGCRLAESTLSIRWTYSSSYARSPSSSARRLASTASKPVTFFDSNLQRDQAAKNDAKVDIEKSWLKAHLRSLTGQDKSVPEVDEPEINIAQAEEESRVRATNANAKLTLDDEPPDYPSEPYGGAYRDLIIRCTTFDAEGNVRRDSEPVAKSSLCTQHNLQPRDLRKIDSRLSAIPTM